MALQVLAKIGEVVYTCLRGQVKGTVWTLKMLCLANDALNELVEPCEAERYVEGA